MIYILLLMALLSPTSTFAFPPSYLRKDCSLLVSLAGTRGQWKGADVTDVMLKGNRYPHDEWGVRFALVATYLSKPMGAMDLLKQTSAEEDRQVARELEEIRKRYPHWHPNAPTPPQVFFNVRYSALDTISRLATNLGATLPDRIGITGMFALAESLDQIFIDRETEEIARRMYVMGSVIEQSLNCPEVKKLEMECERSLRDSGSTEISPVERRAVRNLDLEIRKQIERRFRLLVPDVHILDWEELLL